MLDKSALVGSDVYLVAYWGKTSGRSSYSPLVDYNAFRNVGNRTGSVADVFCKSACMKKLPMGYESNIDRAGTKLRHKFVIRVSCIFRLPFLQVVARAFGDPSPV
ncbi:hypothetical protein VNO77_03353 [Canavalia gladiata]|uniref:Uncharacterized protein n=1 Tax=Canavalia gladiata TaxID=3824 RepID=A0AAN9MZI9_CANGL